MKHFKLCFIFKFSIFLDLDTDGIYEFLSFILVIFFILIFELFFSKLFTIFANFFATDGTLWLTIDRLQEQVRSMQQGWESET